MVQQLDAFSIPSYTLRVVVSDNGVSPETAAVTVEVQVYGVTLPGITINNCPFSFNIDENLTPNGFLQQLTTSDSGSFISQNIQYSVQSGDIGVFQLQQNGIINILLPGNYEAREALHVFSQSHERTEVHKHFA